MRQLVRCAQILGLLWFSMVSVGATQAAPLSKEPFRVIYQMYVRAFYDGSLTPDGEGDFAGILAKVDYLQELGVDTLLLMPIFYSTGDMGYIPRDYFRTDPAYGSPENFRAVVAQLKTRGFKVILDAPVNHISFDSTWFLRGSQRNCDPNDVAYDPLDPTNAYCDYFYFSHDPCNELPYANWHKPWHYQETDCTAVWFPRPNFDPAYHRPEKVYATFFSVMPDLKFFDFGTNDWNEPVVEAIEDFFTTWTLLGADGYRIDAAKHFVEGVATNANPLEPRNQELLARFLRHARSVSPDVSFLGEIWAPWDQFEPYLPTALDMVLDFPFMEGVRSSVSGNYGERFKAVLQHFEAHQESIAPAARVVFAGNHDVSRMMTEWNDDERKLRLAHFLTFSTPFIPLLYYGEEIGMHGKVKRPDGNSDEEYVRTINAFPWDGLSESSGWPGDLIPVTGHSDNFRERNLDRLRQEENSSFHFVRKLIALRKDLDLDNSARLYVNNDFYGHVIGWTVVSMASKGEPLCHTYVANFNANDTYELLVRSASELCGSIDSGRIALADGVMANGEGRFSVGPYGKLVIAH